MWCIKRDQFETKNTADADTMAAETANRYFVNALFIHSILYNRGLFNIVSIVCT